MYFEEIQQWFVAWQLLAHSSINYWQESDHLIIRCLTVDTRHEGDGISPSSQTWMTWPARVSSNELKACQVAYRRFTHATVPNRAPTPAVNPMASAPQNVTRIAPTVKGAPPACAATPPRSARKTSEVPETRKIRLASGDNNVTTRGMAAPTAKLAAEARAA